MYSEFISNILAILQNFSQSMFQYPVIYAFSLGLIGAFAPCQITSNLSLLTLYTSEGINDRLPLKSFISFTFGKLLVYSLLGYLAIKLGNEFQQNLTLFFPYFSNVIGPIWIISGFWLIFPNALNKNFVKIQRFFMPHDSHSSAFSFGVFLTLGFCPTMFSLFFLSLLPFSMQMKAGFLLPIPFTIGTVFPLIILLLLLYLLPIEKINVKKTRMLGKYIQRAAGILILLLGVYQSFIIFS